MPAHTRQDKVAHKSDEERNEAAALFAALKEAHEVLSHEPTRREYDQMMGVDELMSDTDFDLADIEAALQRVRQGLGRRRPPPTYYEVDVTLEEMYTGCVKEVVHARAVGREARRKETTLRIAVPRGAVGGTEFVFRHLGEVPPGGDVAGDVIVVLREVDHPSLVRHGDDLVHAHGREATAEELLLLLAVPALFGKRLSVVADTLAARLLGEGQQGACVITLPGLGMPRASGERRQRYVTSSRKAESAAASEAAEQVDDSMVEWHVEELSSIVTDRQHDEIAEIAEEIAESLAAAREMDAHADEDEDTGEEEMEVEVEEEKDDEEEEEHHNGGGLDPDAGQPSAKSGVADVPVAPYGWYGAVDTTRGCASSGGGGGGGKSIGDEMYGDLIVTFSARECVRASSGVASILVAAISNALPPLMAVGPRPRPALASSSREARARDERLRAKLVAALCKHILPHAARRVSRVSQGPAVWLTLGGAGPQALCDGYDPQALTKPSCPLLTRETETAALCVRLMQSLAPRLAIRQLWLPTPTSGPDSTAGASGPLPKRRASGLALLDDEVELLRSAPLVLVSYCLDGSVTDVHPPTPSGAASKMASESEARESMRLSSPLQGAYVVTWQPGVFVRALPSVRSKVVGMRRARSVVTALRRSGDWVEIAPVQGASTSRAADAGGDLATGGDSFGRGAGGWVLTSDDASGFGRLLTPMASSDGAGSGSDTIGGRSREALQAVERALRSWRRHPLIDLLREEHTMRGLPIISTEDGCALLGRGIGCAKLVPWQLRAMRGEAAMLVATTPPPPPPEGYELPDLSKAYVPPKAYEAGSNIFDLSKVLNYGTYVRPRQPPRPPPPELVHVQDVCLRTSRRRRMASDGGEKRGGGGNRQEGGIDTGLQVIGLGEDEVLVVSGGGRFESAPERSALLERRVVALLRRVRWAMEQAFEETSWFESRLHALRVQYSHMNQHVDKRLPRLCLYTEKELKKWFSSGGYEQPSLNKTDEREKARRLRDEGVARLQVYMQRFHHQLMLSVAQRCTGWSPA